MTFWYLRANSRKSLKKELLKDIETNQQLAEEEENFELSRKPP